MTPAQLRIRALIEAAVEAASFVLEEELRELDAGEVEQLLGRGHGWAAQHFDLLGGYREGRRWRFPLAGVRAYQERRAQEQAGELRARRTRRRRVA